MQSFYVASFADSNPPDGNTTHSGAGPARQRAERQKPIYSELPPHVFEAKKSFATEAYVDIVRRQEIEQYLATSEHYSVTQKHWNLPHPEPGQKLQETALYKPLRTIFDDIRAHFYNKPGKEIARATVLTQHETGDTEDEKTPLFSQPNFIVTAIGSAFKNPAKNLLKGNYDCAAGVMDAKLEGRTNLERDFKQLAVYAQYARSSFPTNLSLN